jgi:hypothetical protein
VSGLIIRQLKNLREPGVSRYRVFIRTDLPPFVVSVPKGPHISTKYRRLLFTDEDEGVTAEFNEWIYYHLIEEDTA